MVLKTIAFLFSVIAGYFSGYFIGKYTKEELRIGKKYLKILAVILFIATIVSAYKHFQNKNDDSLALFFSLVFLLFLLVGNLVYARKRKH